MGVVSFTPLLLYLCRKQHPAPSTHCIEGWVDPRADLDIIKKRNICPLPGIKHPNSLAILPIA
jgi:hypothetical protein